MAASAITKKLRQWRRDNHLTQAAAAERMGVARRTWLQWENGIVIPGADRMSALVTLTGGAIEPNDFYALTKPCEERRVA